MPGVVSFVSLGPGDPALRTVRAAALLVAADVVVTDAEAATPERLVALAREGKHVVRAIDGDAVVLVSALREVLTVATAGVRFEIVPGVGARSVAAAFAGVVGRARRVPVEDVARELHDEPADAVVTLVTGAGDASQKVVVTTVGDAVAAARAMGHPTVVVSIGAPDDKLRWFESQPLFGKRVLVTRAREQGDGLASLLRESGAEPVVVPTIVIAPPADPAPLARSLADLRAGAYAWVAFTSANGVERTWAALRAGGFDARSFGRARLAAVGPGTAAALAAHGLEADVQAKELRGEGLAAEILRVTEGAPPAGKVLLPRGAKARDVLPDALRAAGWQVDVATAYETHPPDRATVEHLARQLDGRRIDAVTFTSSSTVDHLCDLLGSDAARRLAHPRIASIGPVTAETARGRGLRVDVTAATSTVKGLVEALEDYTRSL